MAPLFLQERQFRVSSPPLDCTAVEINYQRDLIVHYSAELQGNEAELKLRAGRQREHQRTQGPSSTQSQAGAVSIQLHWGGKHVAQGKQAGEGKARSLLGPMGLMCCSLSSLHPSYQQTQGGMQGEDSKG